MFLSGEKGDANANKEKITDESITDGSIEGQFCSFVCRSVRIGSYKAMPREKVVLTNKGLQIKTPAIINCKYLNFTVEFICVFIYLKWIYGSKSLLY